MAHILLPNKWRTQPQGNVLLRPEYLGNSRTFIIGSNDLVGADGKPITYSAAKTTYFARGFGPGGYYIGAGTTNVSVNAYTYNKPITVSDPYTLIFFSRLDESKTALTQLVQQSNYSYLSAGDGTNAKVCFAARYDGEPQVVAKITDPTAYTVGADVCYVLTHRPGLQELWRDGILVGSATSSTNLVAASGSALVYAWPSFYLAGVLNKAISSAEAREISRFPYAIVKSHRRVLYFDAGSAGPVTGTLAASENSDTAALTGDVIVKGALSVSESVADSAALAGKVLVEGALSASESGADTAALAGDVLVKGALSASESGNDTASFIGEGFVPTATGALAASESGSDTASIAGKVYIAGTLSAVEGGLDGFAASGNILVQGTLAASETGDDAAAFVQETLTLTPADLNAIAAAVWADPAAVAAHAKLDAIIARITC